MYVILVNEDNTLVTTQKENIMQRSKLVDDLWFLVPPEYKGYSMADFTVMMEYLLPVSKKYRSEILSLSDEMHNEHAEKNISVDHGQINLTREDNSQFIPFIMPRYYDGFDLSTTKISFYYVNKNNYDNYSDPINVYYSDSQIRFGWLIDKYVTAVEGKGV